jgi:hypothetical protein
MDLLNQRVDDAKRRSCRNRSRHQTDITANCVAFGARFAKLREV